MECRENICCVDLTTNLPQTKSRYKALFVAQVSNCFASINVFETYKSVFANTSTFGFSFASRRIFSILYSISYHSGILLSVVCSSKAPANSNIGWSSHPFSPWNLPHLTQSLFSGRLVFPCQRHSTFQTLELLRASYLAHYNGRRSKRVPKSKSCIKECFSPRRTPIAINARGPALPNSHAPGHPFRF